MDQGGTMSSFLISGMLFLATTLQAHDYGTFGTTYPIEEEDMIQYIRERLLNVSDRERILYTQKQIQTIKEPKSLGFPNATRYRCFSYDPSVTVREDIKDHEGNIILKQGTRYNPLENYRLPKDLLFFDATQESHLNWARAIEGTWILTSGSPLELEEQENRPVYFDQFGYLSAKFKIKAIPAKVSQEGKVLKVEELPLEDLR